MFQSVEKSVLVDVRTRAEWGFVGTPDLTEVGRPLVLVEWATYPDMSVNPDFVSATLGEVGSALPEQFFFICRSGARSMKAATAFAEAMAASGHAVACFNVAEGFEGDLDADGHRGIQNGWKARGLAWRQS